jgi:DNA adenine methylase
MESRKRVAPVRPPAAYIGGKRLLAGRICKMIEAAPHDRYGEPFVGMGGIFFRRERRPKAESVNDISRDVITLFRILQRHYVPFMEMLKWRLSSRAEFERRMSWRRTHQTNCCCFSN